MNGTGRHKTSHVSTLGLHAAVYKVCLYKAAGPDVKPMFVRGKVDLSRFVGHLYTYGQK